MSKLGIGVLLRDNKEAMAKNLEHHAKILKNSDIPFYIFDNSVKDDNTEFVKRYPQFKYYKHSKDLNFDDSYQFACENVDAEYVWIIGNKMTIDTGSLPCIMDFLNQGTYSAVLVNSMHRLSLFGKPFIEEDRNKFLKNFAWHSTLVGSTILHRDTIKAYDKNKYRGYEYPHLAALLDGIAKNNNPMVIIPYSLTTFQTQMVPVWLPKHVEIWTKMLYEIIQLLPEDIYGQDEKVAFCSNNGYNGALISDAQFRYLNKSGFFTEEILDKYLPWIKKVCSIPEARLRHIAKGGN